jgi:hypothetical protein
MIIGISGYAGSGKDALCTKIQELDKESNWQRKKWAGKLKQISSILTGISEDMFEDTDFKNTNLGPEWNATPCGKIGSKHKQPLTVREFLQRLGTDAIRDGLHTNAWVNALIADYKCSFCLQSSGEHKACIKSNYPNWIITDTRFPNEAEAIKNSGGIVIRVDRISVSPINAHYSEIALDNWDFDYYIDNSGTEDDLADRVNKFLETIVNKNYIL